ncbi:MAG: HAMP domain-containing histidine kinase [Planctomycetota bacterium]|nr:MAG: HAMP domain-containing histidine kinase [Planctomycetota bacterium]
MAVSLRARLTLILVLVNLVVLGALALWISGNEQQQLAARDQQQRAYLARVKDRFEQRFAANWLGDVAEVLSWPLWNEFADAVVLDHRTIALDGSVRAVGAFLNPNGSRRRPSGFPLQDVVRAVDRSSGPGAPELVTVAGGMALPLQTADRRIWGGVWVRLADVPTPLPYTTRILLAAALATLLGAGLVYVLLRRAVLAPVEHLARAAHEFGAGGAPQLPPASSAPELGELVHAFAAMMARIRGFQDELRQEVSDATARASEAERRAARQERLAAMGTLAAGLAHEINSPLSGALAGLETLRREASSERARKHGQLTQDALDRIGFLVRRLLQLAPAHVEAGSCELGELAADVRRFLESRLRRHRLRIEMPPAPLRVKGAPGDLFPVLLNLVQNALDALDGLDAQATAADAAAAASGAPQQQGGRAGTVLLRGQPGADGGCSIVVADDGPGADPKLLPHLFEPFVTSKEPGRGTGLGLALAHAVVRQLGGTMTARNLAQGGLEVEIRLPAPDTP